MTLPISKEIQGYKVPFTYTTNFLRVLYPDPKLKTILYIENIRNETLVSEIF
jgi:hypothetical protein